MINLIITVTILMLLSLLDIWYFRKDSRAFKVTAIYQFLALCSFILITYLQMKYFSLQFDFNVIISILFGIMLILEVVSEAIRKSETNLIELVFILIIFSGLGFIYGWSNIHSWIPALISPTISLLLVKGLKKMPIYSTWAKLNHRFKKQKTQIASK